MARTDISPARRRSALTKRERAAKAIPRNKDTGGKALNKMPDDRYCRFSQLQTLQNNGAPLFRLSQTEKAKGLRDKDYNDV